ncbi:unnamed protein product [Vitrella brassicaformis CCMP3155]|uniref:Uncharacterized protein n=1 Tax=Vitrella brassicaformis (strain CCMP3155) TaxID=1169540 RepID=A0A0G4GKP2_VITBC|nr:unnamed protein product [Vitrella brassicaformis CCMP3155]|eukprot:CEM30564.1 unnamed protein product [Vitrella brassicaformis CCMP3155]
MEAGASHTQSRTSSPPSRARTDEHLNRLLAAAITTNIKPYERLCGIRFIENSNKGPKIELWYMAGTNNEEEVRTQTAGVNSFYASLQAPPKATLNPAREAFNLERGYSIN